jgi:hypothetical protein
MAMLNNQRVYVIPNEIPNAAKDVCSIPTIFLVAMTLHINPLQNMVWRYILDGLTTLFLDAFHGFHGSRG